MRGGLRWALRRISTLDLRSLALMRIAYGLVLLSDLFIRARSFVFHYTDQGALPLETLFRHASTPGDFSLYAINGSMPFAALLFTLQTLAALAVLVGYRTQAATAVCWLMWSSLQDRNFTVLNGGDVWLRLILLWAIFLPWGQRWSLDAGKSPAGELSTEVASTATFAYIFQEFLVYFLSGLHKTGASWWQNGNAVYYSLQLDEWASRWATELLYVPQLIKPATLAVLGLELTLPLCLLTPWWIGPFRIAVVAAAVLFHGSLMVLMKLGVFPAVGIASSLGLLPAAFWRLAPGRKLEGMLDRIATRAARWSADPPRQIVFPRPAHWALVCLMSVGLLWNIGNLKIGLTLPYSVQSLGRFLTLDQNWELFAPDPPTTTGWMVVEGFLDDGSTVNLLQGHGPATRRRPTTPSEIYRSQREKRYFVVLGNPQYKGLLSSYCHYLFRQWETRHPERRLERVRVTWMQERTLPDFEDRPPRPQHLIEMKNPQ
jgi:hypothetical protein